MCSILRCCLKLQLFICSVSALTVQKPLEASVCGAGPAGLLTAICLSQKLDGNCQIHVYDKRPAPIYDNAKNWEDVDPTFYNLGLGERGISSLIEFGAWENVVREACILVPGRMDWQPGSDEPTKKMLTDKKYGTYVLPRDKLVSVLHRHVQEHYSDSIHLCYEHDTQPISSSPSSDAHSEKVRIQVSNLNSNEQQIINSDLVVACDGAARTFVREFERQDIVSNKKDPISIVRFEDDNQRVFKSMHFRLPKEEFQCNLNYAIRSADSRLIFDSLPVNLEGDYVGILLFQANDAMANQVEPGEFRQFLDQEVPQFSKFISDREIEKTAAAKSSTLPMFRYVTPRLHHGENCVILGDSAKTVKPYFGLGCNSALEDVKIFGECLDDASSIADAVSNFSSRRAKDIEVLVTLSASLDKPGPWGVFQFIFPIILDGIFHKLAPQLFAQNVITMLQRDDITFQEVAERKRGDRIAQLCCLSLLVATIPNIVGTLSLAATTFVGYTAVAIQ